MDGENGDLPDERPGEDEERPLVFVTVGTDHHPFHRIVEWVDRWLGEGGSERARCVVQYGTSRPPTLAEHRAYVPYDEMERLTAEAAVVVCHGGPGSVMLVRWAGKKPIVVPRQRDLGEHVDDHQVVFSRRMAQEGELELADDEPSFRRALDRALDGDPSFSLPAPEAGTAAALRRFEELVGGLPRARARRRSPARPQRSDRPMSGDGSHAARRIVLYIGGWGRSGSTLVERVLGQVEGFASVGEVRELWQRGLVENRPCGCGAAFHDCPFWTEVGRRAYGGWESIDRQEVLALRYGLDRGWTYPLLAARRAPGGFGRRLDRYASILDPLYRAIGEASGANVVIDSSKLPSHALILRRVPGVDLRMVHLVRDSRGVAFSWSKLVRSRTSDQDPKFMERYNPLAAAARYDLYNTLTRRLARMGVPYLRVRYEDFAANPRATLEGILRHAGIAPEAADLSFLREGRVDLDPSHTVDGNPMRFAVGSVAIRADEEWRSKMSGADRFWVTTLTAPLLRGYGYTSKARARTGTGGPQ